MAVSTLNYLLITAIGRNRPGLVDAYAKAVRDCGCSIVDSRVAAMGNELGAMLLLSGNWNSIAKLEDFLPRLEERLDIKLISARTEAREPSKQHMPYAIEVVSSDRSGVVFDIASFFSEREINIEDLFTGTYAAAHTGTIMFSLHMTISIPVDTSIATLRGEFMEFCDQLNLDSIMEPVK